MKKREECQYGRLVTFTGVRVSRMTNRCFITKIAGEKRRVPRVSVCYWTWSLLERAFDSKFAQSGFADVLYETLCVNDAPNSRFSTRVCFSSHFLFTLRRICRPMQMNNILLIFFRFIFKNCQLPRKSNNKSSFTRQSQHSPLNNFFRVSNSESLISLSFINKGQRFNYFADAIDKSVGLCN